MTSYQNNWWVFPGFEIVQVATNLSLPVNLAFVKNESKDPKAPFFYISELYGQVKVISNDGAVSIYAKDLLNYEPDFKIPGSGESGLTGICVEPKTGADLIDDQNYLRTSCNISYCLDKFCLRIMVPDRFQYYNAYTAAISFDESKKAFCVIIPKWNGCPLESSRHAKRIETAQEMAVECLSGR